MEERDRGTELIRLPGTRVPWLKLHFLERAQGCANGLDLLMCRLLLLLSGFEEIERVVQVPNGVPEIDFDPLDRLNHGFQRGGAVAVVTVGGGGFDVAALGSGQCCETLFRRKRAS